MEKLSLSSASIETVQGGGTDFAVLGLCPLNMSIQLLENTQHDVVICHAQMARDTLVSMICPVVSFLPQIFSGPRQ